MPLLIRELGAIRLPHFLQNGDENWIIKSLHGLHLESVMNVVENRGPCLMLVASMATSGEPSTWFPLE